MDIIHKTSFIQPMTHFLCIPFKRSLCCTKFTFVMFTIHPIISITLSIINLSHYFAYFFWIFSKIPFFRLFEIVLTTSVSVGNDNIVVVSASVSIVSVASTSSSLSISLFSSLSSFVSSGTVSVTVLVPFTGASSSSS
eukprot:TRINITY_DN7695_c0_g1_i1.p1 TRINITY_DN7695_c0_g1~~TRINITY_DN7695_c0_g1_i1.p1  ORF type:complete len:138 (+),score=4.32 TRINITY_DN7695_c0_g1_i1:59-472(+)